MVPMISDWKELFDAVKSKAYSQTLHAFLDEEYKNQVIYPPRDMVYNAFRYTSPKDLKIVIIGQDPYHNPGQAMGLSFSVPKGLEIPPSLVNIYKEIESDCGIRMNYQNGDLTPWAKQGVLLLNAYLTVRANAPLSHRRAEYDAFIADVMDYIDTLDQPIVFLLWGGFAKRYLATIHNHKHKALLSVHPSPLSANRGGWFGNRHFSSANDYLLQFGVSPIDWTIK
ncbi:MAG: uracil-DNA glycosylase [Bacilli bacterium]|nr:uracil-DNA glycosylase [Bacilli bacterium]